MSFAASLEVLGSMGCPGGPVSRFNESARRSVDSPQLQDYEPMRLSIFEKISGLMSARCGGGVEVRTAHGWLPYIYWPLICLTSCLGLVGNALGMATINKKLNKSLFNRLLLLLCLADILVIQSSLLTSAVTFDLGETVNGLTGQVRPVIVAFNDMFISISVYLTVTITVERYQAVCQPLSYHCRQMVPGHPSRQLFKYITAVLVTSLLFSVSALLVGTAGTGINFVKVVVYLKLMHPLLTVIWLPFLVMTVLNCLVIFKTRKALLTRTEASLRYVMVFSFVFLLLNLPELLVSLLEAATHEQRTVCKVQGCYYRRGQLYTLASHLSIYCRALNSSLNVIMYCFTSRDFRSSLQALLGLSGGRPVRYQLSKDVRSDYRAESIQVVEPEADGAGSRIVKIRKSSDVQITTISYGGEVAAGQRVERHVCQERLLRRRNTRDVINEVLSEIVSLKRLSQTKTISVIRIDGGE